MASGIYCIRCTANGKVYVGQAVDFRKRWTAHKSALGRQKHRSVILQRAWNKYGSSSFTWQVLEYVETDVALLQEREQYWIDELRAAHHSCGFNRSPSARCTLGLKYSPESRAKLSEIARKRQASPETRAKLSQLQSARRASPETRAKMSQSQQNRSPEWRAKVSERNRKRSPEIRAKISEANRKRSPEIRAKIGEKVRQRTPEVRERSGIAIRAGHARKKAAARAAREAARSESVFLATGVRPKTFKNPTRETQERMFG